MSKSSEASRSIPNESGATEMAVVPDHLADPTPGPCPIWCVAEHDVKGDSQKHYSDFAEMAPTGDIRTSNENRQIRVGLQYHVREAVRSGVMMHVTDSSPLNNDELCMTPGEARELALSLTRAALTAEEPDVPFKHYGWCAYTDDGPNPEDCGPNGRDCTTPDHRVRTHSCSLAGAGGMNDGGALHATLTNTADHGPAISLTDQIGTCNSAFPAWELNADEAKILGRYLLSLAVQARQEGASR